MFLFIGTIRSHQLAKGREKRAARLAVLRLILLKRWAIGFRRRRCERAADILCRYLSKIKRFLSHDGRRLVVFREQIMRVGVGAKVRLVQRATRRYLQCVCAHRTLVALHVERCLAQILTASVEAEVDACASDDAKRSALFGGTQQTRAEYVAATVAARRRAFVEAECTGGYGGGADGTGSGNGKQAEAEAEGSGNACVDLATAWVNAQRRRNHLALLAYDRERTAFFTRRKSDIDQARMRADLSAHNSGALSQQPASLRHRGSVSLGRVGDRAFNAGVGERRLIAQSQRLMEGLGLPRPPHARALPAPGEMEALIRRRMDAVAAAAVAAVAAEAAAAK